MKQWRFGAKQVISMERPPKYPNGFYENFQIGRIELDRVDLAPKLTIDPKFQNHPRGALALHRTKLMRNRSLLSVDVSGNRTNKS